MDMSRICTVAAMKLPLTLSRTASGSNSPRRNGWRKWQGKGGKIGDSVTTTGHCREILAAYGGVHLEDIQGMRAPFVAIGGNCPWQQSSPPKPPKFHSWTVSGQPYVLFASWSKLYLRFINANLRKQGKTHVCIPTRVNHNLLQPPAFPYTLDHRIFHDCMIPPCPTKVREHQNIALYLDCL